MPTVVTEDAHAAPSRSLRWLPAASCEMAIWPRAARYASIWRASALAAFSAELSPTASRNAREALQGFEVYEPLAVYQRRLEPTVVHRLIECGLAERDERERLLDADAQRLKRCRFGGVVVGHRTPRIENVRKMAVTELCRNMFFDC